MRLLLLAPLLAGLASPALAGPLTFDQALAQAVAQAPSVRARSLEVESRRSAVGPAGQLPDPRLGIGLDNYPVSGPPAFTYAGDGMTMARVGVSQEIPNLGKRRARTGRALADVSAAEADRAAEQRRVRVATAKAWLDLAYAERRLAAADRAIARLARLTPASISGVASGSTRPAQSLDIRQAAIALEDRRSEVAAEVARGRANLARWTGDPDPEIVAPLPEFTIDPAGLRAALDRHPDLSAALARTRQAEAGIGIARAEKRPDWGFEVAFQRRAPSYGNMISVGATVSLPLFTQKRQDPLIASSAAAAGAAFAEQEDVRRALAADLEAGLADHTLHHDQWMRSRDTLLPLAQQRLDLEIASYAARRAGLPDVIQAHMMLIDAELQMLDREATVARDATRLVLTYQGDIR
jgi:cobalt-zinc-cadmium efflux system outer membrane protein